MKIRFRRAKLSLEDDGYWLCLRPERDTLPLARRWIYSAQKDGEYTAEITPYRKKRSLDANAYCWVMIGKLAEATGIPKQVIYREAVRDIGGNYYVIAVDEAAVTQWERIWSSHGIGWMCEDAGPSAAEGKRNIVSYYGSSEYDTRQMSRMIDRIVDECRTQGIETAGDQELSLLLEEWDAHSNKST